MTRYPIVLLLLAAMLALSACESREGEGEPEKKAAAAPALVAPTTTEDGKWKAYLGAVAGQHQEGVTDRQIAYYLPVNSTEIGADGRSMYDRQSEQVISAISRTVLPGNQLVFGSPDSAKMADLMTSAFSGAKPDALKGSQVLFIGKPADSERVRPLAEAAGAKYIFVEAK